MSVTQPPPVRTSPAHACTKQLCKFCSDIVQQCRCRRPDKLVTKDGICGVCRPQLMPGQA